MDTYDVIVIGLGAMGGAAAYHCAKRGVRVLGLDANPPHHTLGSSHGATRAIRETYFESPGYVPLAQRSFELWRELEAETGTSLLATGGAIYVGPEQHGMLKGVVAAADQHGLSIECLTRQATAERFPGFALPDGWEAVYEPRGGVLQSKHCLDSHIGLARRNGADIRFDCAARSWRQNPGGGVVVETDDGRFEAGAVILTLGPWACDTFRDLDLPLAGRRITVVHFEAGKPSLYDPTDMSVYFWATPEGVFAGFPHFEHEGVKIMRHDAGEVCTPSTVRREVSHADVGEVARFADKYMPHANRGVRKSLVCLYTMTPDNHFIIDRHPGFRNLAYAAGFSGHGFKFAPVVGEILADLVLENETSYPIDFLSADRFAVPRLASG